MQEVERYNLERNSKELIELARTTFSTGDELDFTLFTIANSYDIEGAYSKFRSMSEKTQSRVKERLKGKSIEDLIGTREDIILGKLILTNINKIGFYDCKNKFIVMRSFNATIRGCIPKPDLSPSPQLLRWFVENKNTNGWYPEFRRLFLEEMATKQKLRDALIEMDRLLCKGEDVVFACGCGNHLLCHRNILGDFYELRGVEVIRG